MCGVHRGVVSAAVVGHHSLHGDAVAGIERDRSSEEADDGGSALIGQDFDVGQAGAVIDRDMHTLPSRGLVPGPESVFADGPFAADRISHHPGAGAVLDAAESFDVDVDQFAGRSRS